MKKILLFAVTLVAMAACNKAVFDEVAPQAGGRKVTVSVLAEDRADTRVSYDDDWATTWNEGDNLLAVDGAGFMSKFTMDTYDVTNPTFSGDILNDKYNLIYPYSVVYGRVSNYEPFFNLDLTSQSAGAKHTYLISEKKIESSEIKPIAKMMHIGATVLLDMKFMGYDGYTVESLEVNGLNSKGALIACEGFDSKDLLIALTANIITITDVAAKIEPSTDGVVKVRLNILPTTIEAGGEVRVKAYLRGSYGDMVVLTKTITADKDVVFDRAKYHTLKCGFNSSNVITYDDDDLWTGYVKYYSNASGGSTEENPYEISTPEQLAYIAYYINDDTENTYEGKYFKLTADIDLSAHKWVPIGQYWEGPDGLFTKVNKFKGTFDGNGHKITGLYIDEDTNHQGVGLFGHTDGATIKNLSVSGYVKGRYKVGGIVGYNYGSIITNCFNSASVKGYNYVGGIVGYVRNGSSRILNCYNSGSIKSDGTASGGVVGGMLDYSIIINCYNSASVKSSGDAGGVVGYILNGNIKNCYSISSVEGSEGIGGIVGRVGDNNVYITNCHWDKEQYKGNGIGANNGASEIGLVGNTSAEMKEPSFVTLLNKYACIYNNTIPESNYKACAWAIGVNGYPVFDLFNAPTKVKFSGGEGTESAPYLISDRADLDDFSSDVKGGTTYSGIYFIMTNNIELGGSANEFTTIGKRNYSFQGIFDGNGHSITGLYISKDHSDQGFFGYIKNATIKNLSVSGHITKYNKNDGIGGVVGLSTSSTIINCHSSCTVNGFGSSIYIGGIVGAIYDNSRVINCYSSSWPYGGDGTDNNIGGVVGYSYGSTITNCYSSGKVSGNGNLGGIIGHNNSSEVTYCYWNSSVYSDPNIKGAGLGDDSGTSSMTKEKMISSNFQNLLNETVFNYNNTDTKPTVEACGWGWESGEFPYLIF